MLRHTGKVLSCLLAVGAPVFAQQSEHTRTFKLGGAPLQQPAERLPRSGGGRHTTSGVDDSQAVASRAAGEPREPASLPPAAVNGATELALANLKRDNAIQLAEKRVEFARARMAELGNYNRWSPPDAQPPLAVRVLPYSMSYAPVSVTDPVESFVPRSTFPHVLMTAKNELTESELQLQALVAERNAGDVNRTSAGEATTSAGAEDSGLRLAALEASLRRERFMAESAELRLEQLSNLSRLTYSGVYVNLSRKLELKRLEHELAAQSLEAEREALGNEASSQ